MQTLPPSDADVSKYISVCFNQEKVSRAQLVSQKALTADPAEYIRCARLRQQVCPVFADVAIDEERARQQWPEPGVPPGIAEGAQAMDTLHTFAPNLDGPARVRAASCQVPCADEGDRNLVADSDAATAAAEHGRLDADGAFEPQAWPAAFVHFFYGVCAPNLARPPREK